MNSSLRTIWIIEDDLDIQTIGKMALEAVGGFQVRLFDSGKAVLERTPQDSPDLILLDVMMPGMDGPTTLAGLRGQPATADTPVVFMTAQVQPNMVTQYYALGAVGVISKPFDPLALPDTLREIWRGLDDGK